MTNKTYRLHLGEIEVCVLNDGKFELPAGYFANVPTDAALGEQIEIGANLWVVRAEDRVILVDTGSAEALKAIFPETGQAWEALQSVTPTDIVLTHMHADHLGGFLNGAAFPNATIHIAKAEWEFWTNPALVDAVDADTRPMVQMIQGVAAGIADRVELFEAEQRLISGLTFIGLPGHTPGHSGLKIEGGEDTLFIIGDAVISEKLQFTTPEVSYALDGDAAQAVATRKALLSQAAQGNAMIAATHFAFPGIGRVTEGGAQFRYHPL